MAIWRDVRRILAGAAIGVVLAHSSVRADLLSTYFPAGVPGYGTAPGITVASRARPEFDAPGMRIGSFMLRPTWDEALGYDNNLFGGSSQRGSWMVGTHPSLLVASDWSRNSVGGFIGVDDARYLDQPRQDWSDWTASLGGAVSIGRDQLTVAVAHLALHQLRTDLDALPSDTPVTYRVDDIRAGYTISLNRLSVTPSVAFSAWRYDNTTIFGAPAPQGYRDRDVLQGDVTTRYELAPQRNLLLVTRVLGAHYVAPQPGVPARDSTGYQVLVGLDDDADAVWNYRVLLGWEMRAFRSAQYSTHQAPIAEAAVIWNPSGLTTVTARLTRSIEDAAQEGIAGYTDTSARLVVDHEYLRNVLLQASAGVQRADYLQGGGHTSGFSAGAGATWLLNRHMRLSATYDFTDQRGTASVPSAGSYTRSVGLLTLRLGM